MSAVHLGDLATSLVLDEADRLGFWRPTGGADFDLFLFGLRNDDPACGSWDDVLGILWYLDGVPRVLLHTGTTDPGKDGTGGRSDGVAMMCAGQHRACWRRGVHKLGTPSAHKALVQCGPIPVWRDPVGDGVLDDLTGPHTNATGINMHGARARGAVNGWSLGCQVRRDMNDHVQAMGVIDTAERLHPTWTTYTNTLFTLRPHGHETGSPALRPLLDLPRRLPLIASRSVRGGA